MNINDIDYQGIVPERFNELRVTWSIISLCNYSCDYCISANQHKTFINRKNIDRVVLNLKKLGFSKYIVVITGGEPLLHPDIIYIASSIKDNLNSDVKIITNGSGNIEKYKILLDMNINLDVSIHYNTYNIELIKNILKFQKYNRQISILSMFNPKYFDEVKRLHSVMHNETCFGYIISLIRKPPTFQVIINYKKEHLLWFEKNTISIRNSFMNPQEGIIYKTHLDKIYDISEKSYHDLINHKDTYLNLNNFYCLHNTNSIYINVHNMYNGSVCNNNDKEKSFLNISRLIPSIVKCNQSYCTCPANLVIPKSRNLNYLENIRNKYFYEK